MTYKTLTERVKYTFVVILPNENKIKFPARSIHCDGRHFQVLCEIFALSQTPKTVQLSTGNNSAKCKALNSYIECVNAFAVIFPDVTNCTPYWAQY